MRPPPVKSELDLAVRRATAFIDWADMLADMRKGYVPTLRVDDNASPTAEDKAAVRLIIEACKEAKCRAFTPDYSALTASTPVADSGPR